MRSDSQSFFDSIRRIVQAIRLSSKESEKRLGVSAAQLFILQKIAASETPPSINNLAEATFTHQSSVSVVVSKLVRRKLIERVRSKQDSRAVELQLSKQGSAVLGKSPGSIQKRLMDAVADMSEQERRGLIEGLQILVKKKGRSSGGGTILVL